MNRDDNQGHTHAKPRRRCAVNGYRKLLARFALVGPLACATVSPAALADEGGVSVWLPGQFGSLAAAPGEPRA
jgi:hypothetical protein